jgi:HSP20 family protein
MFNIVRNNQNSSMSYLFNEVFNDAFRYDARASIVDYQRNLAFDITEQDSEYQITANVPGIRKDDIIISIDKNVLTIEVNHNTDDSKDKVLYRHRERYYGKYQRRVALPDDIDSENIKATLELGVLCLLIPKKEYSKPKSIQIH